MIRNLKALGLALVAMLAIGAMSASAASATDVFTSPEADEAWVTGIGKDHKFEITSSGVNVVCTTGQFTGTVENGASEATALAEYEGKEGETPHGEECTGLGSPTVEMNHCHYRLTGETENTGDGLRAPVWIQCPDGEAIEIITTLGVTLTVPGQTPTADKGGVSYENIPNHSGDSAVKINAQVTGITYECHPAFLCGLAGVSTHGNDADYTGDVTVTGYEDNGGTLTSPTEGSRVPIEWSS